ncbi:cytochrome c biogenesis protein CcdA [Corynebacterium sp. ES2730-CONJ]|uniref:cytochrome c biogenesis CcdA family protein n=1 Tax=Corynebacterium sp. ES2730-CONJ TaxID=2973941 RepID=UPI00216AC1A4|nr:cytochrome c biogenesis protein CcdA [Corynebacterium sp. ES2730-CONJ]MCS4531621.1 cytochrome c biogenesis protein CcdA [Corynebacterium sp. ES2730-CONJ]
MQLNILSQGIGESFATTISSGPLIAGLIAAMIAGLVSFLSPCVLPLVPGYISYLAALVGGDITFDAHGRAVITKGSRMTIAFAAILFIAGFTIIFVLATASVFGLIGVLALNNQWLSRIGGLITIVMGLVFLGKIPFLQTTRSLSAGHWSSIIGAPILGAVFALGWTPCLGPSLAAIISIAAGTEGVTALRGVILIIAYCLGLGIPFLIVALGSVRAMAGLDFLSRHAVIIHRLGGIALILTGLALLSGLWSVFISYIQVLSSNYALLL